MTHRCAIRVMRWGPRCRRWTVVQPWPCLWVVSAQAQRRCDACDRRITTRHALVVTFPSREDWRRGNLGSPQRGTVYCGDCARVWYGVWCQGQFKIPKNGNVNSL